MMDLYYFILALTLLVLILVTCCLEKKNVMYFMIILFIFLTIHKLLQINKFKEVKEHFAGLQGVADALSNEAKGDKRIDNIDKKIENLTKSVEDVTEIVRLRNLEEKMKINSKGAEFDLEESQKKQDDELLSLEKELDVLLKLYRKEIEDIEKGQYKPLPVFSSCKVKEEGDPLLRDYSKEGKGVMSDGDLIKSLENEELLKNLGIDSKTSMDLYNQMQNGQKGDIMDFNINFK